MYKKQIKSQSNTLNCLKRSYVYRKSTLISNVKYFKHFLFNFVYDYLHFVFCISLSKADLKFQHSNKEVKNLYKNMMLLWTIFEIFNKNVLIPRRCLLLLFIAAIIFITSLFAIIIAIKPK